MDGRDTRLSYRVVPLYLFEKFLASGAHFRILFHLVKQFVKGLSILSGKLLAPEIKIVSWIP